MVGRLSPLGPKISQKYLYGRQMWRREQVLLVKGNFLRKRVSWQDALVKMLRLGLIFDRWGTEAQAQYLKTFLTIKILVFGFV